MSSESNVIPNCLLDELHTEILLRLPEWKFVIQCKCVCKRWAAMASDPWFISQFIAIKMGRQNQNLSIIMQYTPDSYRNMWNGTESIFFPSILETHNSTFSRFQFPNSSVQPVASCNDLLLCSRHVRGVKYDNYIMNIQTKQWIELPPSPYYYKKVLAFGIICDDPSIYSCTPATYRYSVVAIHPRGKTTKLTAHVFSSTNQCQWRDRVLSLPIACDLLPTGLRTKFLHNSGFCFNGKLHFRCREGFFGFDQNNIESDDEIVQCHLLRRPSGLIYTYSYRTGVSEGELKLCTLNDEAGIRVWILKDYNTSNWMLQHKIEKFDWVSRDFWLTKKLDMFPKLETMPTDVLGFHPSNSDIIYVIVPGGIFLCDLSSRTLELACRIPVAASQRCATHYLNTVLAFSLVLPIWPTPLPCCSTFPGC